MDGFSPQNGEQLYQRSSCTVADSAPDLQQATVDPYPLETLGHSQASVVQSPVGSLLLSTGSWWMQGFVVPSKSLFPWGFSVLSPDPQVGKSVVGPRTFATVQELLWYNCSPVCGLPVQWLYSGPNGDFLKRTGVTHIILLTKVYIVKAVVFLVVIYGCESWTLKKAEHP